MNLFFLFLEFIQGLVRTEWTFVKVFSYVIFFILLTILIYTLFL